MARKTQQLSADQAKEISDVRRYSRARARANEAYISSIVKARQSGATFAVIARAANVSSQAVQEIVRRHARQSEPEAQATVTDIEDIRQAHSAAPAQDVVAGVATAD